MISKRNIFHNIIPFISCISNYRKNNDYYKNVFRIMLEPVYSTIRTSFFIFKISIFQTQFRQKNEFFLYQILIILFLLSFRNFAFRLNYIIRKILSSLLVKKQNWFIFLQDLILAS